MSDCKIPKRMLDLDAQINDAAKDAAQNAPPGGAPPTLEQRLATLREECIERMARDAVQSDIAPTDTFWVVVHDWNVDESDDGYSMSVDGYWTINRDLLSGAQMVRQFDAEAVKARR